LVRFPEDGRAVFHKKDIMRKYAPIFMLAAVTIAGIARGDDPGYYGTVTLNVSLPSSGPANPLVQFNPAEPTFVGPYQYTLTNPVDSSSNPGVLTGAIGGGLTTTGFCMDLTTNINGGQDYANTQVYALGDPNARADFVNQTLPAATITTNIEKLATEYSLACVPLHFDPTNPTVNNLSTAFQYAIWEMGTQTNGIYNVGDGNGTAYLVGGSSASAAPPTTAAALATADPAQIANYWLANMAGAAPASGVDELVPSEVNGDEAQIQAVMLSLPIPQGLPEPVGLIPLIGMALCGIPVGGATLYRRLRKA
jgi:hypothetical protein